MRIDVYKKMVKTAIIMTDLELTKLIYGFLISSASPGASPSRISAIRKNNRFITFQNKIS